MNKRLPILIRGTGSYVPEKVITNQHFIDYLDTTDEWIVTRTGIRERRWVAPDECASTMGSEAAKRALVDAGVTIDEIDLIVCGTATGDHPFPASACFVQSALGGHDIPSFDVGAACAGFPVACMTAAGFIMTGAYRNALVIGTEVLSKIGDSQDRGTVVLFGDAAGAAVLSRCDEETDRGILHHELGTDGDKTDYIFMPAGGSRMWASHTTVDERGHYIRMRGREVFKFAVIKMTDLIDRALESLNLKPDDLKLVIPHQSNLRIIEAFRERLKLPKEKMAVNIDRYGNTSAASVPVALDEARRAGTLHEGDIVLMVAIGAGLTWGCVVIRL